MRVDRSELHLLVLGAGYAPVVLAAPAGQIFPRQNFPMNKKVIVQNAGGSGKQKRVFFRLVLLVGGGAFDQQVVVGDNYRLRFSRADFLPCVFPKLTVGGKL